MLTVYGRRTSANVMKPLWLAEEIGLPYCQVDVGGPFGGTDQADYLLKNPNGLIPTIDDGGFLLWESNAITRYLARQYANGSLWPAEAGALALADQWMDWTLSTVMPMMTPIFWGLVRTPAEDRDYPQIERSIRQGQRIWGILDAHLGRHRYVAGDDFTMADIPLGPQAHRWFELVPDQPDLPHLRAWYRRLTERPGFRKVCMIDIV
ncbi:MAG: glutathione S-transferase family protein [Pseudomonadales bacterium]